MTRISAARISMEGGRVDQSILKSYKETLVGGAAGTNAGSSTNIDLSAGNAFNYILNSATCAFSFLNPGPMNTLSSFTLILKQDGTGGRLATWPTNVVWTNLGNAPALTTVANRFDILVFMTRTAGNVWLGFVGGKNYS